MKPQLRVPSCLCLLAGGLLTGAPPANAQPQTVELIVNGGFETGDLTGWSAQAFPVDEFDLGTWVLNDGQPAVWNEEPFFPISGTHDAVSFNWGPGLRMLTSGPLAVPRGVTDAALRWADRILNSNAAFFDVDAQGHALEFRVLLVAPNGATLGEVFSTNPGDNPLQPGPNQRQSDVTALLQSVGGQTVHLAFVQQDDRLDSNGFASFMNVYLDDVSLSVTFDPTPEPEPEPEPVEITMDVLPQLQTNVINLEAALKATGLRRWLLDPLPVVVFSDESFNALSIDDVTLQFGDPELGGVVQPVAVCTGLVNRSRRRFLVLYFSLNEMWEAGAIDYDTTSLMLTGWTDDGTPFVGVNNVRVLAPKPPPRPKWWR
jgi:hypothetical protein